MSKEYSMPTPLMEHEFHFSDAVDRPTTEVLVKGRGVDKHLAHIRDAVDRPITDVLVEHRG